MAPGASAVAMPALAIAAARRRIILVAASGVRGCLAAVPVSRLSLAGLRQHLALMLAGELADKIGVREHGFVPACPGWGSVGPHRAGSPVRASAGHGPVDPFWRSGGGWGK